MIDIYIGYDEGEKIAYHTLSESIRKFSSQPVRITPVSLNHIPKFTRKRESNQSTDFSFSRFLVPYISKYKGWSIYMDCDMMFRTDIAELWKRCFYSPWGELAKYSVMCCKHDYTPKQDIKFRGAKNQAFPKKNWSSLMLFNNSQCTQLTPDFVNTVSGLDLHQFKWVLREELIGPLPLEWNWLVSEYEYNKDAKNVHWTLGGPWYKEFRDQDYSDEWHKLYKETTEVNL